MLSLLCGFVRKKKKNQNKQIMVQRLPVLKPPPPESHRHKENWLWVHGQARWRLDTNVTLAHVASTYFLEFFVGLVSVKMAEKKSKYGGALTF